MQKIISWRNKYAGFYYVSILLFVIIWFVWKNSPPSLKIFASILFLVATIFFNVKNKEKSDNFFTKFLDWINFWLMLIFTAIYVALSTGDLTIALVILFSFFVIALITNISISAVPLFRKQELPAIILSYIFVSFFFIILCGFVFTLVSADKNSDLSWTKTGENITAPGDYIYFSATSYYTNSVGDITPTGINRWVMISETGLSYLFHVIILGFAVGRIFKNE